MATLTELLTKLRARLSSLNTKTGRSDTDLDAAINALPSKKTSDNVTVSGATVTTPSGIYFSQVQKSAATATRAITVLTSAKSNNTLVFTASNSQTTGYVTANTDRDTATKTVSLSVSGGTVTASDGTNSIAKTVATGSATTPATTITANPTLSTTYTSGSGYQMSVSATKSVTPTVSAGYVSSGTAGTVTVSGSAYVPQSSTGSATTSTTDTATRTIGYGQQTTIGAGYYPSARIIRNSVSSVSRASTSITTTADETNDKLTLTASNNQGTGYVTGSNQTASKVVTLALGTPTVSASGLISASASVMDNSSTPVSVSKTATKELTTRGARTYTPTTSNQTIASGTYLTGTQTIKGDGNLIASNIKSGVSIFGVTGTYEGSSSGASLSACTMTFDISCLDAFSPNDVIIGYTATDGTTISNEYSINYGEITTLSNVLCGSTVTLITSQPIGVDEIAGDSTCIYNGYRGCMFRAPLNAGDEVDITFYEDT